MKYLFFLLVLFLAVSCGKQSDPAYVARHRVLTQQVDEIMAGLAEPPSHHTDAVALDQLIPLGPEAIPVIERQLKSVNPHVNAVALMALERMIDSADTRTYAKQDIDFYLTLAAGPDQLIWLYGFEKLKRIGKPFLKQIRRFHAKASPQVQLKLDPLIDYLDSSRYS